MKDSLRDREQDKFREAAGGLSSVSVVDANSGLVVAIDEHGTHVTYFGYASPGSATSDPVWRITRLLKSGTESFLTYADGNLSFDNIWDNRLSLTYS